VTSLDFKSEGFGPRRPDPGVTSFRFRAQGFGCCEITGDGTTARLSTPSSKFNRTPVIESKPTAEEWKSFWSLVESLDALSWKRGYGDGIMCGTPWRLELRHDGKEMNCEGNGLSETNTPPGFPRLYQAMRILAGAREDANLSEDDRQTDAR
jgi:hypothetical protein